MTQIKETYLHKRGGDRNVEACFTALGQKYEKPTAEAPRLDSTADSEEREKLIFFYHPDHLGSTNFVTDIDGNAVQFISYIPYGEVFVEERNSSFSSSYLFNAKELDNETGLYYYGARYLDPQTASWLSADPLFEKYPGMSPYNFCQGNPVMYIDPDGRISFKNADLMEAGKQGAYIVLGIFEIAGGVCASSAGVGVILIADGGSRVLFSGAKLVAALQGDTKTVDAIPSNIGGAIGKAIDSEFGVSTSENGTFQNAGEFVNDVASTFVSGCGFKSYLEKASKVDDLLHGVSAKDHLIGVADGVSLGLGVSGIFDGNKNKPCANTDQE